jgi:peptide/nickel transport system permease protein
MVKYVLRRLLLLIPILVGLSIIVFLFVHALPGDPADALLGERGTVEQEEQIRRDLGLDKPLYEQYFVYVGNVLEGDLGSSIRTRRPVTEELFDKFPATVELALAAMAFAILVGVPLGFMAARRYQGWLDNTSLVMSLVGISFPVFFLALILKYIFSVRLGWLPSIGRLEITRDMSTPTNFYLIDSIFFGDIEAVIDVIKHLILPAIALGTIPLAIVARITRAAVLDVTSEDYVRTAQAKGLDPSVVNRRHILKNAMLPVVTVIGLQTGLLLTGAVLTETIFEWDGVGRWMVDAISFRDYSVLQSGILFFAMLIVVVNLVVDVSYALLNPRIRYR